MRRWSHRSRTKTRPGLEPDINLQHRRKLGRITRPFLVFCVLLLASLSVYVIYLIPTKTPTDDEAVLVMHQRMRNFITGKKFASRLLPAPVIRWSGPLQCQELGHGIWCAVGVAELAPNGFSSAPIQIMWSDAFFPGDTSPLFVQVGQQKIGDLDQVFLRAGLPPRKH
jgi:hypothetical protein